MSKMKATKIIGKGAGKVAGAGVLMAVAFGIGMMNKRFFNDGVEDMKQGINLFRNSLDEEELEDDFWEDEE